MIAPNFVGIAFAAFKFLFNVREFRCPAEDRFNSGDRLDPFLDCPREQQGVAVNGVINDEYFHIVYCCRFRAIRSKGEAFAA